MYNMAQFFKKTKRRAKIKHNITAVTSEATRVLKRLVSTILKEGKESLEDRKLCFSTPKGVKKPRIPVDVFMDSAC